MYHICISFLLLFISFSTFAQKDFHEGYFIDNDGTRTECYINDKGWLNDPKTFSYQLVPKEETRMGSIKSVKEIGVGDRRYLRFDVQVDKSSNKPNNIKENLSPEWVRDTVFLSVLVDGKADLFHYRRDGDNRFFYRVDDNQVEQLVYKLYRTPRTKTQESRIATNNAYKNQLKKDVNCRGFSDDRLTVLHYDIGVLIKFFTQQNQCWGGEVSAVDAMDRRMLRIKLTPGIGVANGASYSMDSEFEDYKPNISFRAGAEFEMLLPFHRRKWAIILEPAWQSYKADGKNKPGYSITYNSFELALGVRHYFYLGKAAAIYIVGAGVFDVPVQYIAKPMVVSPGINNTFSLTKFSASAAAGVGGSYKRLSVEVRYYTTRETDGNARFDVSGDTYYLPMTNKYQKTSIIVGVRIF